jgi:hypothetical protein
MGSVLSDGGSADGAVLTSTKISRAKKPMMKSNFQMEISSRVIIIFIFLPPRATIIDRAPKRIFGPIGEMMGKKGKGSRGQKIPGAFKGAPSGNSTS